MLNGLVLKGISLDHCVLLLFLAIMLSSSLAFAEVRNSTQIMIISA